MSKHSPKTSERGACGRLSVTRSMTYRVQRVSSLQEQADGLASPGCPSQPRPRASSQPFLSGSARKNAVHLLQEILSGKGFYEIKKSRQPVEHDKKYIYIYTCYQLYNKTTLPSPPPGHDKK